MFLKIGRFIYYVNGTGTPLGYRKDLGTKELNLNGTFYPMWNMSPKRIKILEYLLNNPNSSVVSISRTLHFANPQEVNVALAYFKDPHRCFLIYEGPDIHRYSVLKEKEKEIRDFIYDVRNKRIEDADLEEIE